MADKLRRGLEAARPTKRMCWLQVVGYGRGCVAPTMTPLTFDAYTWLVSSGGKLPLLTIVYSVSSA